MARHFPPPREREIESLIDLNASRPIRRWQFTGSPIKWTVAFSIGYVILLAVSARWLEPPQGSATFVPAAGVPVALSIVLGRKALAPVFSMVVLTEVAVRQLREESLIDGVPFVAARLITTLVAVVLTVWIEANYWHRPAVRTATFCGAAFIAAAAGAPVACWAIGGPSLWTDCVVWTVANFSGIVLVSSLVVAVLQLRPWHSANYWTRLSGCVSLAGAGIATILAVTSGSVAFLLIAVPLIILSAAIADVRLVLVVAAAMVAVVSAAQLTTQVGTLDIAISDLGLASGLAVLAMVTVMIAGIALQNRFVENELSAIIDALPHVGATIDRNYKARRFMLPRPYREQGLQMPEGIALGSFVHPGDLDRAHQAIDDALVGKAGELQIRVNLSKMGARVFNVNVARVTRWRALVIANDITEAQALERERDWEAARYRAIAQSLGEGLAEVDIRTNLVVYANQNWADGLGVSRDAVIGKRLSAHLPETAETIDLRRRLRQPYLEPFEFTYVHPDGSRRWILMRAARIHRPDGGGSLLVLGNDITQLREAERRRLKIENELTMVEQTERERFAKALHSSPIQMLTAVGLQLGAMQGADPDRSKELADLEQVVGDSIIELREIVGSLVPPDASGGRVIQALEHYLDRIGINRDRVRFNDLTDDPPTGQIGLVTFGIAREALMNALLHSGAGEVVVRLTETNTCYRVEVLDDGIGFDLESELGTSGHLGLRSLFEYAATVGGNCELNSPISGGTRVFAELPKNGASRSSVTGSPTIVSTASQEAGSDRYATPSEFR